MISSKEKKEAIWMCTIAIMIGHFIAYYNNCFGIDQLISCELGYFSIAMILMTVDYGE